jgi:GntR family transcriptional regulator
MTPLQEQVARTVPGGGQKLMAKAGRSTSSLPESSSGTAKYARISSIFRSKIQTGSWPVGFQIPTIDQLSMDYNVARITIRQALNRLSADGMVRSERGRGTFVISTGADRHAEAELLDISDGSTEFGATGKIRIVSREADAEIPPAVRRGRKATGPYIRMRKTHSRGHNILFVLDFYVQAPLYELYFGGKESKLPMQDLLRPYMLEHDVMVDTVVNVIFTDPAISELLECDISSPAAELLRIFYDLDGHIIALSSTIYPSEFFRFKTTQTVREYFRAKFPSNTGSPPR